MLAALVLELVVFAWAHGDPLVRLKIGGEHGSPIEGITRVDALLRFAIRAADGTPLTGVRPAAWIDAKGAVPCRDKIQSFLGGTLRARPSVDLNSYYIVTLNIEPSIAVIDPLLGFGGSKLLTAITLQSPGVDWVMSPDQKRIFVAMPLVNRVAVSDTEPLSLRNPWMVVSANQRRARSTSRSRRRNWSGAGRAGGRPPIRTRAGP